jgi:hypothetical protein
MSANSTDPHELSESIPDIAEHSSWHKLSSLPDGTQIGRLGAYWYILDDDGCAISDGYHEIDCDEQGDYNGKRSARTEPVVLHSESE